MTTESGSIETETKKPDSISIKRHHGPATRSREQEKEFILIQLAEKGTSIEALAEKHKWNPKAIAQKLSRLGLGVAAAKLDLTGVLEMPVDFPSLKMGFR